MRRTKKNECKRVDVSFLSQRKLCAAASLLPGEGACCKNDLPLERSSTFEKE
jgi:hypothetical protein